MLQEQSKTREEDADDIFRVGTLGDDYELVGVYSDRDDPGHELEIFIVSVGSEV